MSCAGCGYAGGPVWPLHSYAWRTLMSFVCALPEFVDAVAAESGRGCSTISQANAAACCPDDVDRGRWGR